RTGSQRKAFYLFIYYSFLPEMAVFLWKNLFQTTKGRILQQRRASLYNAALDYDEELIKKKLQQFAGGSVNLSKEHSGIGILTLNNSRLMNAFTGTMMLELQERVTELENWKDGKGLIICGAGNTFCSGSDLNAVKAISNSQARWDEYVHVYAKYLDEAYEWINLHQRELRQTVILKEVPQTDEVTVNVGYLDRIFWFPIDWRNNEISFFQLPLISIALVQGKALGGGAELTTACDFRLMTPGSEIRFVHKHMGLVPGWGGAARLVRIVGSRAALQLLSGADRVDPERALRLGLSEGTLSSSDEAVSLEEARAWLRQYTEGPASVIQAVKKVVTAGRELPLEAALRTEKDVFGTVWGGPANLEALAKRQKHK
ncbi:UNVERIFIED_CONTAM: hypothetical protein H355_003270, partial [Colinus virginianus]